ncbi:Maf family protein [Peptostreptococcus faecalis]|uniref:Maf family protein n=1 Tax=Peptostreptococcus faecalis TaxID=2045015 RepID=UPI000C7C4F70|nr:Maf family protein [Peptostreptococcus faecalis]
MNIILASNSPRRKELLSMCGLNFECESADIDENSIINYISSDSSNLSKYDLSEKLVSSLSYEKAIAAHKRNKNNITVGSDTIVSSENEIFIKPKDKDEAYIMLKNLTGKTHRVYTGVSIITDNDIDTFSCYTEVTFYDFDNLTNKIILDYIDTNSPLDKAGGYGIQDMGALLIKEIKGDYYTVMGLPISLLYRKLQKIL